MKKAVVLFLGLLVAVSSMMVSAETKELRVTRVQTVYELPNNAGDFQGDTVRGSLWNIRSQAFLSSEALWLKMEICASPYLPGCRDVFEKYEFKSFDGKNLKVVDPFGRHSTIKVLRMDPLRAVLPGGVTVDFKEVRYSGVDRHRDITKLQSIREALSDIEDNDQAFQGIFPAF